MKKSSSIFILFTVTALIISSCAPTPTPPPTFTLSPLPPTSTFTPEPTATITPSPTITPTATLDLTDWIHFDTNEWMTLYYPSDWTAEEFSDGPCNSSDCILLLSHLPQEIEIEIYRLPKMIPSFSNVREADNYDWEGKKMGVMITQASDSLALISRNEIKVDGLSAIKRIYEYPLVNPSTYTIRAIQYNYRVLVMKDGDSYFIIMRTTRSDEFEKYQSIMDTLVKTIMFNK